MFLREDVFVLINRGDSQTAISGLPAGTYDGLIGNTTVTGSAAVDVPPAACSS
jgi:hypothetical protein